MTLPLTESDSSPSLPNWDEIREDFPILDQEVNGHPLIYFDNAATSQKPRDVIAAMVHYYEHDNSNVHRGLHALSNRATDAYENARARLARYIGATEEEIVFTRGTTEAVNLVARAWGDQNVQAGDVILLTEMEHHSNLVPWQLLAQRKGASLRFVPITDDGHLIVDETIFEGPVRLLAFTHISNSLGTINPAAELCAMARARGITTLVDCAQSAGHLPLTVQELGCDFLVFSGHKMCGPTGIGILFGRKELLNAMPPFLGGGEMIANAGYESSTYKESPYRFEAGTPAIAEAIGLGVAADYLERIGRQNIFDHDRAIVEYALSRMLEIPGLHVIGPLSNRAALVSFTMDAAHAHDIVSMADQYGLALRGGHHCTQPLLKKLGVPSSSRASFYFYNTRSEVDRMITILQKIQKFFS
jgi:cysteine desulfurase/selenocysteine lyase